MLRRLMSQTGFFFSCCRSVSILRCVMKPSEKAEHGVDLPPPMYMREQPHPSCASGTRTARGFAGPPPQDRFGGMSPPRRCGNTARSSAPWSGQFPALLHHSPGYPARSSVPTPDASTFWEQARIQATVNFTHFYVHKILLYIYIIYILYT